MCLKEMLFSFKCTYNLSYKEKQLNPWKAIWKDCNMKNVGGKNRSQAVHIVVKVGFATECLSFISLPQNVCDHLVLLPT